VVSKSGAGAKIPGGRKIYKNHTGVLEGASWFGWEGKGVGKFGMHFRPPEERRKVTLKKPSRQQNSPNIWGDGGGGVGLDARRGKANGKK